MIQCSPLSIPFYRAFCFHSSHNCIDRLVADNRSIQQVLIVFNKECLIGMLEFVQSSFVDKKLSMLVCPE
jgi:hypothetical protein